MLGDVAQHFDEPHHRKLLDMLDQLDAGRTHLIATDAGETKWNAPRGELARDAGGVKVAGHFPGDEKNVTHDWRPARDRKDLETYARYRARS